MMKNVEGIEIGAATQSAFTAAIRMQKRIEKAKKDYNVGDFVLVPTEYMGNGEQTISKVIYKDDNKFTAETLNTKLRNCYTFVDVALSPERFKIYSEEEAWSRADEESIARCCGLGD